MARDALKGYYYTSQKLSDWSRFLPLLGHNNPGLRVIEIGAGTGAATSSALELLQTQEGTRLHSEYYYTDISPVLCQLPRNNLRNHSGITYKVLDITKDPEGQGFASHTFDLVIASNVLHATPVLQDSLGWVHRLLEPNGWLLLHELDTDLRITLFVMGTLPGWWLGADDGRPDAPFVSPERWDQELRAVGFTGNESLSYDFTTPARNSFTMLTRVATSTYPFPGDVRVDRPNTIYRSLEGEGKSRGSQLEEAKARGSFKDGVALLCEHKQSLWAEDVANRFRAADHAVQWIGWDGTPTGDQCIISLVNIEGPFLYEMDEVRYGVLKAFLKAAIALTQIVP
ncbi:S-adenosyl-L-methionine-dependent methyltransferase [Aspergillus heterothallicus]